jgi:hypothetical protein
MGCKICPKGFIVRIIFLYLRCLFAFFKTMFYYCKNMKAFQRIGPHNEDVISVLVGLMLGDGFAEKRGNSVRFTIHMSAKNIAYLH